MVLHMVAKGGLQSFCQELQDLICKAVVKIKSAIPVLSAEVPASKTINDKVQCGASRGGQEHRQHSMH